MEPIDKKRTGELVQEDVSEQPALDDINQEEINDVIEQVIAKTATWDIGSWVVVRYRRKWFPGRIVPADAHHIEEDTFLVDCMERKNSGLNRFRWPRSQDLAIFEAMDMLLQIDEPLPVAETESLSTGEIVWCELSNNDFDDTNNALKKALRKI